MAKDPPVQPPAAAPPAPTAAPVKPPAASAQPAAPAKPKTVLVRLTSNYGGKRTGDFVEVSVREYEKFRKPDGNGFFTFPVMISEVDEKVVEAKRLEEERAAQERAKKADERSTADGWSEYRRRNEELLRASFIAQQKAQHEALTGERDAALSPEEEEASYRQRVAARRTG